ncbi:MAG: hypothetical protein R2710_26755 [Acidimicrobiales bacterium]
MTCTTSCDCTNGCSGDCTTDCTNDCTDPLQRADGDGAIDTIRLVGIRGGAGTSTIAGVLAMHAATMVPTELVTSDPRMACALLGFAEPGGLPAEVAPKLVVADRRQGREGLTVVDEGTLDPESGRPGSRPGERSLGVLRGPCYLALRTLMADPHNLDGLVLVTEFGRALTERDVVDVTGLDVVATVAGTPSVARTIDSGLLAARYRNLADFRPLRRWLTLQLDPFPARRTDPRRTAPNHPSMSGTDLLLPPVAELTGASPLPIHRGSRRPATTSDSWPARRAGNASLDRQAVSAARRKGQVCAEHWSENWCSACWAESRPRRVRADW